MPPPARQKTDEVDVEHLHDTLEIHAKLGGLEQAFSFGEYERLDKQHAVCGRDLAKQKEFLVDLQAVGGNLLFKYTDLKSAYSRLVKKYPLILARFNIAERDFMAGTFATCTMTMCTHARRLKDEQKFREACRGLASFHVCRLQELRDLVMAGEPELPVKAGKPGKQVKTPEKKELPAGPSWKNILEMEIPATQSGEEEEPSGTGRLGSFGWQPCATKKKRLESWHEKASCLCCKEPHESHQEAKAFEKASQPRFGWKGLVPYVLQWEEELGSGCEGERRRQASGGSEQVWAKKENWAAAEKLLKMLEEGKSYEYVKAQKQKLWKYSWRLGKCRQKHVHSFGG